jgi:hypothetical protein
MLSKVKLLACLAGVVAPCFLMTAGTAAAADETYTVKQIISLPNGQSVGSFDIGFDDANIHTFAYADRTNAVVEIIDTNTNKVVQQLTANPPFAGVRASPGQASGPDGIIIVDQKEVWAGDAPSSCSGSVCTHDSSIKVINLKTGATVAVLNTGGQRRADELCEAVGREVVLMANDNALDSFITFWSTETRGNAGPPTSDDGGNGSLGKIRFDGTDPRGNNITSSGIEQCKFSPRTGKFYLNIPATGADGKGPGVVVVISAEAPFHVEKSFTIPLATGCAGPAGMAIGPDHQILLGCGGTNSLIIDERDGGIIAFLGGATSDEAWYNPGDNSYFLATDGKLSVVDSTGAQDVPATNAVGSHVVAADMLKNQVYVPVNNNPAEGGASKICSTHGGDDTKGCIAVFTAKNDDRCLAEGMPVLDHDDGDDPVFMRTRCSDDRRADRDDHDR